MSDLTRVRLAGLLAVVLGFAIAWFLLTEFSWVDTRPHCSGLAMQLRPELAGECFAGPRSFPDPAAIPALWTAFVAAAALVAVVAATRVRPGRTPRD